MTYVNGGIMKQLRIFAILLLVTVLVTGCGYSGDMIDVVFQGGRVRYTRGFLRNIQNYTEAG